MTLLINITTPEGIVMAADSRQVQYNTKQVSRILTDTAQKLFVVNSRICVGIAGIAFFVDNSGNKKNVSEYVKEYCMNQYDIENMTVEEVAYGLYEFMNEKYPWEEQLDLSVKQLEAEAENNGSEILSIEKKDTQIDFKIKHFNGRIKEGKLNVESIKLLVSGFNVDGTFETYESTTPGKIEVRRMDKDYGSNWIGQGDVVSRLVLGYDSRLFNLSLLEDLVSTKQDEFIDQLRGLEYKIMWDLMTLQDAVDLAVFFIKTTSFLYKYADGINMSEGDVQGVGGLIDVLTITPDEGVRWINKKNVSYPEDI